MFADMRCINTLHLIYIIAGNVNVIIFYYNNKFLSEHVKNKDLPTQMFDYVP